MKKMCFTTFLSSVRYTHATMTILTLNLVSHETKYLDECVYGNILIPSYKVGDKTPRTNFGVGHS